MGLHPAVSAYGLSQGASTRDEAASGQGLQPVTLHLIGTPCIERADGVLVEIERKNAAVLTLAVWNAHASREQQLRMMWPGARMRQAQANLRVVKHRLARAAGRQLLEAGPALRLAPHVRCDASAYYGCLAEELSGESANRLLEQPLLGYFDFPELEEFATLLRRWRECLRELALDSLRLQAERLAPDEAGHDRALALLSRVLLERPEDERACRQTMQLLLHRHDRAGALVVYERCRDALCTQLGVSPSAATQALHRSALEERDAHLQRLPLSEGSSAAIDAPPFVGREVLLPRIWTALRQGRIVWITGQAGMGKTRLITEALRAHARAVYVACRPSDPAQPYASLERLAATLLESGEPPTTAALGLARRVISARSGCSAAGRRPAAAELLEGIVSLFHRTTAGAVTVVVIDDLHHVDPASARVLRLWCERHQAARGSEDPSPLPALVLLSRADEHRPVLGDLIRSLQGHEAMERIDLQALSQKAIRSMLESLNLPWLQAPQSATTLWSRSGGNPYIAIEVIRESRWTQHPERLEATPLAVIEMLRARIERQERAAQELAMLVAVAGRCYSSAMADAVLGLAPLELARAWQALERAGIFDARGLAHGLAGEAVLSHLCASAVEVMQSRIADFRVSQGGEPGDIAGRLVAEGGREEAAPYLLRVAGQLVQD